MNPTQQRPTEIIEEIEHHLEELGVSRTLKGRAYMIEGIHYLVTCGKSPYTVTQQDVTKELSQIFNRESSAIIRTIQTSIRDTWTRNSPFHLENTYTDPIGYRRDYPSTNEFIRYYAIKVRKCLNILL